MRVLSTIHFGPFSLSIRSFSPTFIKFFEKYFSGYECNRVPDFFLKIFPSDEMPLPVIKDQQSWIPLIGKENDFEIGPDLIRGTFNLGQKECSITIHRDFFRFPNFYVFHSFLYRLYHTMCQDRSIKSYFIHGCGVIKENTGYLFIGPHQSGKTTIGELSNGLIIHDDQIIITLDEKGLTMDSPPLPGRFRHHPNKPCYIEKFFFIVQNTQASIKRLNPVLALKSLYDEIVSPLTLYSLDEKEGRAKKGKLCFEILKLVSMFELRFDKKGNFWNLLTNVCRKS